MSDLETCLRDGFDGPTLENRLTIGIPMAIFTAVGLQLNIVLWRIIMIQKDFIEPSFRRHVVCLIAANVGFNLTSVVTLLPISLFKVEYPDWLLITLSTPDSLFYQVILYTNFTIALDRLLMFATPGVYEYLTGAKHYALVVMPWLVAAWIVAHSTVIGCYKRFNPYQLRFQYGCSSCPFFLDLNSNLSIYIPVAIFGMYFVIFVIIFRKRLRLGNDMSLKNRDFIIVLQFLLITVIQLAGNLLFYVNFSEDVIVESLIRLTASCWTTYSNPIVMFVFHERVSRLIPSVYHILIRVTFKMFLLKPEQIRRAYLFWGRRLWIFERHLTDERRRIRTRSTTNIL